MNYLETTRCALRNVTRRSYRSCTHALNVKKLHVPQSISEVLHIFFPDKFKMGVSLRHNWAKGGGCQKLTLGCRSYEGACATSWSFRPRRDAKQCGTCWVSAVGVSHAPALVWSRRTLHTYLSFCPCRYRVGDATTPLICAPIRLRPGNHSVNRRA